MIALIICLLILLIAIFAYRVITRPDYIRIINKLGGGKWLVDTAGVTGDPSYYVQFGRFDVDAGAGATSDSPHGKVHFTKYGMNGSFDYEADLDWSRLGDSIRVGQMKLSLVPGAGGGIPTIMFTNDVESGRAWTAPLKETK